MNIINYKDKLNPTKPLIPLDFKMIKYIILHHPEAITATPEQINEWHKSNGWNCAGYNEYIRKNGDVIILRGDFIGAQCLNCNSVSYGICLEGNYDVEKIIPDAQYNSAIERIKYHANRFPNKVITDVHSKFTDTKCAGQYFQLSRILEGIKNMDNNKTTTIDENFKANLELLKSYTQINTIDYWLDHCVENGMCKGEYVKIILNNFAEFFKNQEL